VASGEPTVPAPPAIAPAGSRPLRLAHRGDHRRASENTIEAFVAAMHLPGCDGVELDVRASADGAAVVLHDETLPGCSSGLGGRPP
jgi:glycerophosphoryl diester phosphodiesterase